MARLLSSKNFAILLRRSDEERGVALVELAVILPLLATLMLSVADLIGMFKQQALLADIVENGFANQRRFGVLAIHHILTTT